MSEGRHAARSSRARSVVTVGAIVVVAAVAVAVVLLISGGKNPIGAITGGDKPIPDFSFSVVKTQAVPTKDGVLPKKLANKAKAATTASASVLNTLYTEAFLDPNVWGKESGAFDDFTADAKSAAAKKLTVLTAGPNAAGELSDLQPAASQLTTKVLFDDHGNAYQVMATVQFTADATLKAGGHATLVSSGQYFLKQVGGSWKVVAFEVRRADTAGAPTPPSSSSTSTGPTPTGTQS